MDTLRLADINPSDFDALTRWANQNPREERSEAQQRAFERKVAEGFDRSRLVYHGTNRIGARN